MVLAKRARGQLQPTSHDYTIKSRGERERERERGIRETRETWCGGRGERKGARYKVVSREKTARSERRVEGG